MARELNAKVARVMSALSIAINVGEDAGVAVGDKVVSWRFVDVTDPDTDDVLGSVRLVNLRLTISETHERFALARVEYETPNFLSGLFQPSKVIASSERALDESAVVLNVGDPVTVFVSDDLLALTADGGESEPAEDGERVNETDQPT